MAHKEKCMAVPESQRSKSRFEVFIKAQSLCVYTIKICTNQNVFLPQYQNALTNDLIRTSKDIFIDCWTANNIEIRSKNDYDNYKERKRLQEKAIRECTNLLAMMQIAQSLFHLKTKRIKYWGEKTVEVKNLIRRWKESDNERFSKLKL